MEEEQVPVTGQVRSALVGGTIDDWPQVLGRLPGAVAGDTPGHPEVGGVLAPLRRVLAEPAPTGRREKEGELIPRECGGLVRARRGHPRQGYGVGPGGPPP